MRRWAAVMVFDELEPFNELVAWTRAHDLFVCMVVADGFADEVASVIEEAKAVDRDMLDANGGVVALHLNMAPTLWSDD